MLRFYPSSCNTGNIKGRAFALAARIQNVNTTIPTNRMNEAKRVILCLPEEYMDYSDTYKPVRLYFSKFNRSLEELGSNRHFIHIQPPSDLSQPNSKIHVIIDLEKDQFFGDFTQDFPHDIYTIRCVGGEMWMNRISCILSKFANIFVRNLCAFKDDAVKQNLLLKTCQFTDELYLWRKTRLDHLRESRSTDGWNRCGLRFCFCYYWQWRRKHIKILTKMWFK